MKANLSDIFEALFWFVIFIGWLISRFRQQPKKKAKKTSAPLSKPPARADNQETGKEEKPSPVQETFKLLKGGLRDFLEEVTKMQEDRQPPQKEQADWEQAQQSPHSVSNAYVAPKTEPVKADISRPKELSPEPRVRPKRLPMRLNLSREGLRQAVLLREILGPPVALREDEKRF